MILDFMFQNVSVRSKSVRSAHVRSKLSGEVKVSKSLGASSSVPELVFNPGASPAVDQSVGGRVNMEELFL